MHRLNLLAVALFGLYSPLLLADQSVHFYRNSFSPFPSGEAPLSELKKTETRTERDPSFLVTHDNKHTWMQGDHLVRDVNLAVRMTPEGRPDMQDIGVAINILPAALRKSPSFKADNVLILSPRQTLQILDFSTKTDATGDWVHVAYTEDSHRYEGFVDLSNVVLLSDFASFALTPKNEWRPVQYREMNRLMLDKNEKIMLADVRALITKPDMAILIERDEQLKLPLQSRLTLEKFRSGLWHISQLKGHGEVFWQDASGVTNTLGAQPAEASISNEELLSREINAIAFHPKNPNMGLVSAGGKVYLTNDAKTWRPLNLPEKVVSPLAVGTDGEIIVGDMLSQDQGEHFTKFIHWSELAELIEINRGRAVPEIHLHAVQFASSNTKIELTLDTGVQQLHIVGRPFLKSSWRMIE